MKPRMAEGLLQGLKEAVEIEKNQPFILDSDMTVFCDVDGTLVSVTLAEDLPKNWKNDYIQVGDAFWYLYKNNIKYLKTTRNRGHKIVVWSAGGVKWGKEVVEVLGLTNYVDIIMAKPRWYLDDLKAEEFMPEVNRIFKPNDK